MINPKITMVEAGLEFAVDFGDAEGVQAGYNEGYKDGAAESGQEKYQEGYEAGYDKGEADGYTKGEAEGKAEGYQEGYTKGEADGHATGRTEGYQEGYDKGTADGTEAGKQAEYNTFWDAFQDNGNRTDYYEAFAGIGWTDETFAPKYNIVAKGNTRSLFDQTRITNLKGIFETRGLTLNLSGITNCQALFANSKVTHVPELDLSGCTALTQLFSYAYDVVSIDKIKVNFTGSGNGFTGCSNLEYVIFEGVIGGTGLDLSYANKLSKASWQSVISCLSATTTGLTVTGSLASVKAAFETAPGANDGNTSDEWLALTATKPNWTIALK